MIIKKSLFRSILIIALLTTYLISASKGYANWNWDKVFCSKQIAELDNALRGKKDARGRYLESLDRILWWENRFIEMRLTLKRYSEYNKNPYLSKKFKNIDRWLNIIDERHKTAYDLLGDMEREANGMELIHKETQLKQYTKVSQILREITEIQIRIAAQKEKLEKLDEEIRTIEMGFYK